MVNPSVWSQHFFSKFALRTLLVFPNCFNPQFLVLTNRNAVCCCLNLLLKWYAWNSQMSESEYIFVFHKDPENQKAVELFLFLIHETMTVSQLSVSKIELKHNSLNFIASSVNYLLEMSTAHWPIRKYIISPSPKLVVNQS